SRRGGGRAPAVEILRGDGDSTAFRAGGPGTQVPGAGGAQALAARPARARPAPGAAPARAPLPWSFARARSVASGEHRRAARGARGSPLGSGAAAMDGVDLPLSPRMS